MKTRLVCKFQRTNLSPVVSLPCFPFYIFWYRYRLAEDPVLRISHWSVSSLGNQFNSGTIRMDPCRWCCLRWPSVSYCIFYPNSQQFLWLFFFLVEILVFFWSIFEFHFLTGSLLKFINWFHGKMKQCTNVLYRCY